MLALLICCSSAGCHTWSSSHLSAVRAFHQGDLSTTRKQLQESLQARGAEVELLAMEQSVVALASGKPEEAEVELRNVRRVLDHLEQKDAAEQTAAILTDERAIAYAGRDYERVMVTNLLLLSSLLNYGQDAFAYATQCIQRQDQQIQMLVDASRASQKPDLPSAPSSDETASDLSSIMPASHQAIGQPELPLVADAALEPMAMSSYLTAAVMSENIQRVQQTEKALQQLAVWNPEFAQRNGVLNSGNPGTLCRPEYGAIHVFVMVGQAPEWVAEAAEPTSQALLIADRILSAAGKHTLPPTIAPVQIARPSPVQSTPPPGFLRGQVACQMTTDGSDSVDEKQPLHFLSLVDMNKTALASYRKHRDHEIARAITRRVVKKGALYAVKETQDIHRNSLVDLAVNVGGVIWEAMEKPDLRSWRLLPARVELAHAEIRAGDAVVQLQLAGRPTAVELPVRIENGRNTYVTFFVQSGGFSDKVLIGGTENRVVDLPEIGLRQTASVPGENAISN